MLFNIHLLLKVRTRLGADAKWRLTVEELELFVNQLETLPAKVSKQEVWYRVSLRSVIASCFYWIMHLLVSILVPG